MRSGSRRTISTSSTSKLKKGAVMKTKATQSFAQHRGTGATPAAGAKAGATQGTFTTSDAIPWKPVDPKNHPGLEMFAVWGNPNEGASLILQKFPAGTHVDHSGRRLIAPDLIGMGDSDKIPAGPEPDP